MSAKTLTSWVACAVLSALSGCSVGYLAQSVGGHWDLVSRARPVDDWMADPATPQRLRDRLALAQSLRRFAIEELRLPDHASFQRFAQIHRPAVIWNVVAAPELSLEPKTWCFPVVGCVAYRGYFDREQAAAYAQTLKNEGLEVYIAAVPAYSTLGKTDWLGGDPLLDTFLYWDEAALARLIFHEMAHPLVFVPGDTAFNESFASAVEQLGLTRWWRSTRGSAAPPKDARLAQQQQALKDLRQTLREIYSRAVSYGQRREAKAAALAKFRSLHPEIATELLNNASLALRSSYDDGVSAFEQLFQDEGQDFEKFYAAAQRWAQLTEDQRRLKLQPRVGATPLSGDPRL